MQLLVEGTTLILLAAAFLILVFGQVLAYLEDRPKLVKASLVIPAGILLFLLIFVKAAGAHEDPHADPHASCKRALVAVEAYVQTWERKGPRDEDHRKEIEGMKRDLPWLRKCAGESK